MKNELKERMNSEGFGTFEKIEGMDAPEYSEEIVDENKVEKSNFDHFKDFSIQQLSYLVESDDIEKSEAAKEILREKLK